MGAKRVIDKIIEEINNGVSREVLEKTYNKGTVTKAYNKIQDTVNEEKKEIKEESNENEIEKLLRRIFSVIKVDEEYEIKISIKKNSLSSNKKQIEVKTIKEVENPFDSIYKLREDAYLNKLNSFKRDELVAVIKKYFKFNKKKMDNLSIKELSNYIVLETKKVLNIGECFK